MTVEQIMNDRIKVYRIETADQKEADQFILRVTKRIRQLQGTPRNSNTDYDPISHASNISELLYNTNIPSDTLAGSLAVFRALIDEYFFATDDFDSALLVIKKGVESLVGSLNTQAFGRLEEEVHEKFKELEHAPGQALALTLDLNPNDPSQVELVAMGIPRQFVNLTQISDLVS